MNTEPRVASAFSRRTPLLALLLALGAGATASGRQLTPVAQPDPAVQQVSAVGTESPASPPPPIQPAVLPPAPVPATFDVAAHSEKVKPMVAVSTWQAFWMTTIEGHTSEEAAKLLGMSVGAVHIAKSRVRNRLRNIIARMEANNTEGDSQDSNRGLRRGQ